MTGRSCCGRTTRAQWPTVGPYIKEQFTPMGAIGIPLLNTIILLTSGVTLTIAHHALKAGHRGAAQALAVPDDRAGLHVPRLPGVRVPPRVHRAEPEALDRRLRLDVLHADRLPRPARDDRRDHADGDARPRAQGPLRRRAPFRASRPPRGTGTSSTSCGCCCSCWSTGWSDQRRRRPERPHGSVRPLLSAAMLSARRSARSSPCQYETTRKATSDHRQQHANAERDDHAIAAAAVAIQEDARA